MIRLTAVLLGALCALAGCDAPANQTFMQPALGVTTFARPGTPGFSVAPANAPSGPVVDAFARDFLDTIQPISFAERREFCGYFYVGTDGRLRATPPRRGTFASCTMNEPRKGQGVIASYHTHGAYAPGYDNEVPSAIDLESDFDYGIDGYVATPGGRIWLVDYQTRSTRQVCGLGCVQVDPAFRPQNEGSVRPVYTLPQLQQRGAQF